MREKNKPLEHLIEPFLSFSQKEVYKKGTILLEEGKICRKLYFIKEGTLRFYYLNEEGEDITHWFLLEGDFITEINSFIEQSESEYYLEVLEDCTLHTCSYDSFIKINELFPEVSQLWNTILAKFLLELGEKIKDLQFRDAKTRYNNLLQKHPSITQRVALKHIASYLGITQQSLSRIRKK
ncbi:Crp/Fnr family transcriptional regulator [Aureispira anguillae]|uniref:Crp/Fnr family transcriptional regulator n=1 Tax=Aureispira anguillae TaxID=2864201 RepID=A0A915YC95_9BACT|nr:Crp/Fnr family transcriptional regulator [Aureispira anguillae]BDS10439.1 Crp/Fnr family transcriptional regulator [Aureispira anguillae]